MHTILKHLEKKRTHNPKQAEGKKEQRLEHKLVKIENIKVIEKQKPGC